MGDGGNRAPKICPWDQRCWWTQFFSEYKTFDNVNDAYSSFIQNLMEVIDKVAPVKSKRIKRNSQEWFDSEISEKLIIRDKLFKKYKKTRLHECIGKPKDY